MLSGSPLQEIIREAIVKILSQIRDDECPTADSSIEAGELQRRAEAYDRAILLFTEECRRQQCDVNERRNAIVRFNSLPVEISTAILLLVFDEYESDPVRGCLQQVSRYWQKLIYAAPRFWTHIANYDDPAVISASLRNSKSAPLSVYFFSHAIPFDNFFDLLLPHTSRLQPFTLRGVSTQPGLDILLSTLPCLRSLRIEGSSLALLPDHPTQPSPIPSLQHLALVQLHSWCLQKLIDWLISFPDLRSVDFFDWDSPEEASVDQRRIVSLPRLESLVLESLPLSFSRALISSVVPTKLRRLELDELLPGLIGAWIPALKHMLDLHGVVHITMCTSPDWMSFNLHTPEDPLLKDWKLECSVNTNPDQAQVHLQELLQTVSEGSPTTRVKLQVGHRSGRGQPPPPGWEMELTGVVLECCQSLEVLWVGQGVKMDAALDYLGQPKQDSSGDWAWPCPLLSEMWALDCELSVARFFHLAKTRWEVPGTQSESHGLRRKKLRRLQVPLSIEHGNESDREAVDMVLENCCEERVHGAASLFL